MSNATDQERGLRDREVAITGRLASMSREEAQERIASAGGRFVGTPGEGTDFLVVGQGGPPLGEDGRLTKSLRAATALHAEGAAIRIVPEEEFLGFLGWSERQEDLQRLYTTAQLSRILDVPAAQIRTWVRHDLIRPVQVVRRLHFFDFRQVSSARILSELSKNGVRPQRLRRSLEQIETWFPGADRLLAQLETLELEGGVLVRTDDGKLAEPSGQLRLDFQEAATIPPPALAHLNPPRGHTPVEPTDASEGAAWFQRGIRAEEEGNFDEAIRAYEQAIGHGEGQPEVYFNLGNTFYALERPAEAAICYRRATDLDEQYVEAWNNLGNMLAEVHEDEDAVAAYRRALAVQDDYADAHFNLAETLANLGDYERARHHWRSYLEQDPSSTWANVVRERLRRTDPAAEAPETPPQAPGH